MIGPRLTTRRLMILILTLAVGLGLGLPAIRVWRDGGSHDHFWPITTRGFQVPGYAGDFFGSGIAFHWEAGETVTPPFGMRYWRVLTGRPWAPGPGCGVNLGHPGETCSQDPAGAKVGIR